MRKLFIAAIGVLALATAGLAVATGITTKTASAVTGGFTATTAANVDTKTCTTTDGKTIADSKGTYTGTASGSADLTGPITLNVHSTINTTDGYGIVSGKLKIDVASGKDTVAAFDTVYDHGGVVGLAEGRAQSSPAVALVGNLSAGYSAAGGFTGGKIGSGASGGSAIELGPGKCAPAKPAVERSDARGTVSDVSSSSITVAGLQCNVPTALASKVATIAKGDRAEIHCQVVNGANTLQRVEKLGK
jgi:hypothetical protein